MEATLFIAGVNQRSTSKGPVYDVETADGTKYSTFEAPLAQVLSGLVGQTIRADVTVKQNGQYTNRYLNKVLGSSDPVGGEAFNPQTTANPSFAAKDTGKIAGRNSLARAAVPYVLEMVSAQTKEDVVAVLGWLVHWSETGEDFTAPLQAPVASFQTGFDQDIPF